MLEVAMAGGSLTHGYTFETARVCARIKDLSLGFLWMEGLFLWF